MHLFICIPLSVHQESCITASLLLFCAFIHSCVHPPVPGLWSLTELLLLELLEPPVEGGVLPGEGVLGKAICKPWIDFEFE